MEISFLINGSPFTIKPTDNVGTETSLNTFIRTHAKLPGTKFMCLEGGCGACIVSLRGVHPTTRELSVWAVNSCLYPVYACHGLEVITIEGIGNRKDGHHDLQKRLAKFNGSQCGFCSPGMVMNMFSLMEGAGGKVTMTDVERSFGGNICRCTGYRPILDAFKSVAVDASRDLRGVCGDIEDLKKCPKTGRGCEGLCLKKEQVTLTDASGKTWVKVFSLKELLQVLGDTSGRYMLVHGNTAHGVYRRDPDIQIFIDVTSVPELHEVKIGERIELGASVSITETMNAMLRAAKSNPNFEYCLRIWKHLDLVANVPVRNVGTLAGNLMMKHEHHEFQSDIFLLLETVGALIEVVEGGKQSISVSPRNFLKLDMKGKVIAKISLPQLPSERFLFRSFKIMPRAQHAHAYVNAGFLAEVDQKGVVQNATIVFGGIEHEFIRASKTEAFLVGKNLFTDETFQGAKKLLSAEVNPDLAPPEASPRYRKELAIALFYKFILDVCPAGKTSSQLKSGGEILNRPLSSGKQEFSSSKEKAPLTQNIPKIEGLIQSSGEAEYVNDIPPQPHELWAAFVLGTKVGAVVLKIDASAALRIPGVRFFFDASDIPGTNNFMSDKKVYWTEEHEEIFASTTIKYHGQPVGIILADTFDLAHKAALEVQVVYGGSNAPVKILPTILDVLRDGDETRYRTTPFNQQGKALEGEPQHRIKGHFEMGGQFHFTLELQSCVTIPSDEGLNVYSSTQWMDLTQIAISDALGIPNNQVNVFTKRLGGAYGSKVTRATWVAVACSLGAYLTNRPVRFVMQMEQNMQAMGKRLGCVSDYEVDVDSNGKILRLENNYVQDYGHSINESCMFLTHGHFPNCYRKEVMTYVGRGVVTDSPSHTWCRGPGNTEGTGMIENIMEHVARVVGRDPTEVRLENIEDQEMRQNFENFLKDVEYQKRRKAITEFNQTNRWRKRGLAVVPMKHHVGFFGAMHAHVAVYHGDGTVAITHGGIEMGQGLNTKVAQMAAHILQIPLDQISIKQSNNFSGANGMATVGNLASDSISFAVKKACEQLLARLEPVKQKHPDLSWPALIQAAYFANTDLISTFKFDATHGNHYELWGAAAAEVEVDLLTGNYVFHRVDLVEDTGESLNPGVDVGQIEGSFIMAMGYWLQEQLVYDKRDGKLLTNRTWNYKVPTAKDIPVDFRVKLIQERPNTMGVLGSKATGDPATSMSIVCLFAIRDALDAARRDAGIKEPWYHLGAPTTCETIFLSGGHSMESYKI